MCLVSKEAGKGAPSKEVGQCKGPEVIVPWTRCEKHTPIQPKGS